MQLLLPTQAKQTYKFTDNNNYAYLDALIASNNTLSYVEQLVYQGELLLKAYHENNVVLATVKKYGTTPALESLLAGAYNVASLEEDATEKKTGIFGKIKDWFVKIFTAITDWFKRFFVSKELLSKELRAISISADFTGTIKVTSPTGDKEFTSTTIKAEARSVYTELDAAVDKEKACRALVEKKKKELDALEKEEGSDNTVVKDSLSEVTTQLKTMLADIKKTQKYGNDIVVAVKNAKSNAQQKLD